MMQLLLSGHLYQFEGSQAADQWLKGVNVDEFAVSEPKAGLLGIQIQEEKLELNYHLDLLQLSQLSLLLGKWKFQFLALECQMKGISRKEKII